MHSAAWKHFCLNGGVEVGFCISGIYGKIYLLKSIQLYYILRTVSVTMFRIVFFFFLYVIRLYLGCSNSWCHIIETPAFCVSAAHLCYAGLWDCTLRALRHYLLILLMKGPTLYPARELHFPNPEQPCARCYYRRRCRVPETAWRERSDESFETPWRNARTFWGKAEDTFW